MTVLWNIDPRNVSRKAREKKLWKIINQTKNTLHV